MGTMVHIALTEAHDCIGKVERRHPYMRKVHEKLRQDLPEILKDQRFSMTFRALIDTHDYDTAISATTLEYGVYPKLPVSDPRSGMIQPANTICLCSKMFMKLKAQRMIGETEKKKHVASQSYMEQVRTLKPESTVILYREVTSWQQYELVRIFGNKVHVILPAGKITYFSINVAGPYHD